MKKKLCHIELGEKSSLIEQKIIEYQIKLFGRNAGCWAFFECSKILKITGKVLSYQDAVSSLMGSFNRINYGIHFYYQKKFEK